MDIQRKIEAILFATEEPVGIMEISKKSFGKGGGKIFSLLQFMNTIGWLSVNLIISPRSGTNRWFEKIPLRPRSTPT